MREITPHKGGRDVQVNAALTAEEKELIWQAKGERSLADWMRDCAARQQTGFGFRTCTWELRLHNDHMLHYRAACGHHHFFEPDSEGIANWGFCPYCGGRII